MRKFINENLFTEGRKYKFCESNSWYTCSECDFKKDHIKDIFSPTSFLCKKWPCEDCNLSRVEPQERICLHETI